MRHPCCALLLLLVAISVTVISPIAGAMPAYAGNDTMESQVARALLEEAARGKIKIVILDFTAVSGNTGGKATERELKDFSSRFTEEFILNVMNEIKNSGKRDSIAIIDRSRLDDILRENNASASGIAGRSVTEIGRMAGIDVIISGRVETSGGSLTATAKVVRVKDGEILNIVKQDRQEQPAVSLQTPVILVDAAEKLAIGAFKALPLNLTAGGTLTVSVNVIHGNPVDVQVVPGRELERLKDQKEVQQVSGFTAANMKSYKRSAYVGKGDYYLVLRDSSLGVFSARSDEIKIVVQLEPWEAMH